MLTTNLTMVPKHKIDNLILNYFIQEGFQEAAVAFSHEIGVEVAPSPLSLSSLASSSLSLSVAPTSVVSGYLTISQRKEIKRLILGGHITAAIAAISEHFPQVLDQNNLLHFKLLRLCLIEMIRAHKLAPCDREGEQEFLALILAFVRQHMVAKVLTSYKMLHELEVTMLLLCFKYDPDDKLSKDLPADLRDLFDLLLRTQCYRLVNQAILQLRDQTTYTGAPHAPVDLESLDYDSSPIEFYDDDDEVQVYVPEEPAPVSDDEEEEVEDVSDEETTLELKLERVVKLWAVTEQRMADLNIRDLTRVDATA